MSIFPAPPPWTAFNQTWSSFVVFHYCQCRVCPAHYRSLGHHPLLFRIHFSILHLNNHFLHNVPSVAVHSVLELKKNISFNKSLSTLLILLYTFIVFISPFVFSKSAVIYLGYVSTSALSLQTKQHLNYYATNNKRYSAQRFIETLLSRVQ